MYLPVLQLVLSLGQGEGQGEETEIEERKCDRPHGGWERIGQKDSWGMEIRDV